MCVCRRVRACVRVCVCLIERERERAEFKCTDVSTHSELSSNSEGISNKIQLTLFSLYSLHLQEISS